MHNAPVLIIGAGVAGLSIGRELVRAGEEVVLFDRGEAGRGTSWLAAGMLAPDAEIGFEELELYRLNRESLERWPDFAEALNDETGIDVDFRTEGTLLVADDRDHAEALRRRFEFQKEQGLAVEWLTGQQAREIEPFLAPRLPAAVWSPSDHQVDNRLFLQALRKSFEEGGGTLRENTTVEAVHPGDPAPAVTTASGERIEGSVVIVAAGVESGRIGGLSEKARPPVRPVKGQMLELRMEPSFDLTHVVRGAEAYLAPKSSGRLLVGATMEERGFDTDVTAGGMYDLLEGAWEVVPGIYELPVTDSWAGLRPAARDNAPLLGHAAPGVILATGHFRHGILLAPVTAQEIAHLVLTGETSRWLEPFRPTRFA